MQDFFGQASGAVAARLEKDSVNIVPLVREAYEVNILHYFKFLAFIVSFSD